MALIGNIRKDIEKAASNVFAMLHMKYNVQAPEEQLTRDIVDALFSEKKIKLPKSDTEPAAAPDTVTGTTTEAPKRKAKDGEAAVMCKRCNKCKAKDATTGFCGRCVRIPAVQSEMRLNKSGGSPAPSASPAAAVSLDVIDEMNHLFRHTGTTVIIKQNPDTNTQTVVGKLNTASELVELTTEEIERYKSLKLPYSYDTNIKFVPPVATPSAVPDV